MGTYTAWEHYETFGGWPEEDDHSIVPSAEGIDAARKERLECPPPVLPADHPGFIECSRCHVGVRADRFTCPACGADT